MGGSCSHKSGEKSPDTQCEAGKPDLCLWTDLALVHQFEDGLLVLLHRQRLCEFDRRLQFVGDDGAVPLGEELLEFLLGQAVWILSDGVEVLSLEFPEL